MESLKCWNQLSRILLVIILLKHKLSYLTAFVDTAHSKLGFLILNYIYYVSIYKNGLFIDFGAHDGEFISNTLWLEKEKGWDGLLIEADPEIYSMLKSKNRHATISNACLSPTTFPQKVNNRIAINKIGRN